jgi:glycerol-3-phosphate dehydrogenase (NAD(P)+)
VVLELAARYGVELPIATEVYGVVHEGRTAQQAYRGLTRRMPGAETDVG